MVTDANNLILHSPDSSNCDVVVVGITERTETPDSFIHCNEFMYTLFKSSSNLLSSLHDTVVVFENILKSFGLIS